MTLMDYRRHIRARFPWFADLLRFEWPHDPGRIERLSVLSNEFETDDGDGRGESYRRAQRDPMVRLVGISKLFCLAAGVESLDAIPPEWRLLDVLGGDGTLAKTFDSLRPGRGSTVITGDLAGNMITEALRAGLPAVRQQAQRLLLRDEVLDAVLVAYGSHHIPVEDRMDVCQEAYRVLRPNGRLVFHDFAEESRVAYWFSEVVDRYSRNGHEYPHFAPDQLRKHLDNAGFNVVDLDYVYDPFVVSAATPDAARRKMGRYLFDMYGLVGLAADGASEDETADRVWRLASDCFAYDYREIASARPEWKTEPTLRFDDRAGEYRAEVPRLALVAVGHKLSDRDSGNP
ncbi:class I SAM-dependent methyltransferase [Amycolatopsis nigrescens]|uniref:class I SAM-dependent methyltransferase n=1 Tax=Amycolatopsis nigrescens TaxID=381445 RepID=UPI00037FC89A|nr:methyltransferase domain-containing protein [Amycolatopsis nigrescens]